MRNVMSKRQVCLICFVFVLSLAGSAFAAPVWDNETGDRNWGNPLNWDTNVLPASADWPSIDILPGPVIDTKVDGVTGVVLNSHLQINGGGSIAIIDRLIIGNGAGGVGSCTLEDGGGLMIRSDHSLMVGQSGGSGTFNMNGGTMSSQMLWLGRQSDCSGVVNFSGGITPNVRTVYVGDAGDGTLNMNGGTLTSIVGDGQFIIANVAGSTGHVNLNAGTILTDSFTMGAGTASMDVTGGMLVVEGDVTATIQGYITAGLITTSGPSALTLDYDTINNGKTTLFALPPWAGKAIAVFPLDGDIGVNSLKWTGVAGSESYKVYLSDSSSLVTSRDISVKIADIYVVANTVPDIAAAGIDLTPYQTYYWAVDCLKTGESDLPGDVWEFTAADPLSPIPPTGSDSPVDFQQLKWTLPSGVGNITCDVVFGTDPSMANNDLVVDKQPVESVFVNLTDGQTYYWQLAIYDDSISATVPYMYSPVYTFTALERQMETLDRGLTVMNIGSGKVFISWRMLKTDPSDIAFNVYRNSTKLNTNPGTQSTNRPDSSANLTQANTYQVRSIIDGQEQLPGATFVLPANPPVVHDTGDSLDPAVHLSFPFSEAVGRSDTIEKVMVGDLNGDGKYDYIIKHPQGVYSTAEGQMPFVDTYKITAFNSDGTFMWEVDLGVNMSLGGWFSPALVYDLDGDGKAEVIAKTAPTDVDYRDENGWVLTGPEWFTIFDGETGAELVSEDWIPRGDICADWNCSNNNVSRNQLAIAYLDGVRPSLIVVRGIYAKMVAEAWNFNQDNTLDLLWQWNREDSRGGGFHSLRTGDIDGDGREEVLNGSVAIDDNGKTMWCTEEGHGDDLYLTDIDPSREGLEVFYIQEGGYEYPIHLRDAKTGDAIWQKGDASYGDVGRGLVADIDPRYPGVECWTANPTAGLISCDGTRIGDRPEYLTDRVCNYAFWWGTDLLRELSHQFVRIFEFDYVSSSVVRVGSAWGFQMAADVVGDWREELIYLTGGEIRVGTPMTETSERFYTFMQDPIYRNDVSSSGSGYYQSAYTSFYVGSDVAAPTPDAMRFDSAPAAASTSSITMTATTATAYGHGGVEYYFQCVTGNGNDSGWVNNPTYTDKGLSPGQYSYRVKARGLSHLETAYSTDAQVELFAGDFNLDGEVDIDDLAILALNWLEDCQWPAWCVNGETVDLEYLSTLAADWLVPSDQY